MEPLDPQQTIEDSALFQAFLRTHEYDRWRFYVNRMIADSMSHAVSRGAGDWEKGVVEGLRIALQVPEKVIYMGKQESARGLHKKSP